MIVTDEQREAFRRDGKDWPHMTVDRQEIAMGDPVHGDVSPIAWPRPDGDLPPTPADGRAPGLGYRSC